MPGATFSAVFDAGCNREQATVIRPSPATRRNQMQCGYDAERKARSESRGKVRQVDRQTAQSQEFMVIACAPLYVLHARSAGVREPTQS